MDTPIKFALFAAATLIGMIVFLEIGRRVGQRQAHITAEGWERSGGALGAAVAVLFGLLLAFTFFGASSRFDHRRELITQEANAISTAYLRIDLLPTPSQPAIRSLFREYVQARISQFEHYADQAKSRTHYQQAVRLQGEIWTSAIASVNTATNPPVAAQLLPALNAMFELTTSRQVATLTHPPRMIFFMLFGLALVVSVLAGYNLPARKTRHRLHVLAFAGAITATLYVIMDIEFPRLGYIRIDPIDRLLVDVLENMR